MHLKSLSRLSRSLSRILSEAEYLCRSSEGLKLQFRQFSTGKSFVKEDYVQKYLASVKSQAEKSPNGFTNQIPNLHLKNIFNDREEISSNLQSLRDMQKDESESNEWKETIKEEILQYEEQLSTINLELINSLVPQSPTFNAIEFEITAGVGGKEAMLFAKDLFDMYQNYFNYKSWVSDVAELDTSELGGIRHGSLCVEGPNIFQSIQYEAGVHRVQRVPATERSGRIHTSTATVAVFPQPAEVDVELLSKDLIIETKRSSGAGGQHVNTTDSCVRITHIPTGISIECQTERSQIKNKKIALNRLRSKIYQKQIQEHDQSMRESRKIQVGTSARSDKVRTYNYPQDRITDHRIQKTFHNLPQFLKGGQMLDEVITMLQEYYEQDKLRIFLESLKSRS
ncbi:peptide chain release factor 1-like, mitochondrial [Cimex lectularius]|uniref:Peptide chain release factor domain-containing protein n=1 Tax=Cimex lectularius TaxID=79782 RepID=A0A8I6RGY4_CIMLE|nr:peptide chain release factor 1-like, mitochondrial [Cimex lectularius]